MYCYNCGKKIDDKAVICVGCGVAVDGNKSNAQPSKKMSGWIIASLCLLCFTIISNIGTAISYGISFAYAIGSLLPVILSTVFIFVDYNKSSKSTNSNKSNNNSNSIKFFTVKFARNWAFDSYIFNELETTVICGGLIHKPIETSLLETAENKLIGWYQERDCINQWNFNTDRVNCDMTLYAKWKAK